MSISTMRQIITNKGGTPTQYAHRPLVEEMLTALGATPTSKNIISLLQQLVTVKGGTLGSGGNGRYTQAGLLRSLILALGGTPATYLDDALWEQVRVIGI